MNMRGYVVIISTGTLLDMPLNTLLWLSIGTFAPAVFFALYADISASLILSDTRF